MARSALKTITSEAKRLKKKYHHRYDKLPKKSRWSKGYIKQASAIYATKHHGKSPVGKKRKRKTLSSGSRRTKRVVGRKVVRQVERKSVERVLQGKRRATRRRPTRRRAHVMAGTRRRSVGKKEGSNTLLLVGLAAAAVYFLTRKTAPATGPALPVLPPLTQTGNYTRNSQSQDILNYAMAAGLAGNLIINLVNKLNSSSDSDVQNMYDDVSTGGDVGVYV